MRTAAGSTDPPTVPLSRLLRTGAALVAVAAALAGPAPASAADALDRARATGRLTPAEYALERARSLFSLTEVRGRWGAVQRPDPHDATPILRDLRAALPHLRGHDRAVARGILARPSDRADDPFGDGYSPTALVKRLCDAHVCVHWVETTRDAPPLEDLDVSGLPDWVETTQRTFADVWQTEIDRLGYAPPLPDAASTTNGGDARLDVYLVDIGRSGYFGYCTTDDPESWITTRVSAYCVLDDDFADPILQLPVPVVGLHVTAAHEFFHAVQFGYDWLEELWFMEGTAVWMEDEVFDGANDLVRYLGERSPLGRPDVPLDVGHAGYEYGAWLFWRYLSERHDPGIVRSAWTRAVGDDSYSLRATRRALAARGSGLTTAFAGFGAANRTPRSAYREGVLYPRAVATSAHFLGPENPDTGWLGLRVAHLATKTVALRPRRPATAGRVTVEVAAGRDERSAAVTLVVVRTEGRVTRKRVPLDGEGHGRATARFGGSVRRVDIVLTNAGSTYRCWRGTDLSCQGVSLDDNRLFRVRASL
jgi:hypothetical protein